MRTVHRKRCGLQSLNSVRITLYSIISHSSSLSHVCWTLHTHSTDSHVSIFTLYPKASTALFVQPVRKQSQDRFKRSHHQKSEIINHIQCGSEEEKLYQNLQKWKYSPTLLEEKVLYRTLKDSISTTYLEPLKGSIHS